MCRAPPVVKADGPRAWPAAGRARHARSGRAARVRPVRGAVRRDRGDGRALATGDPPARQPRAAPSARRGAGARPRHDPASRGRRRPLRRAWEGDLDGFNDPELVAKLDIRALIAYRRLLYAALAAASGWPSRSRFSGTILLAMSGCHGW